MRLTVGGAQIYAYSGGKTFDAALPCVAFVHGAQHDHSVWHLQSRYFAHHGYAVLAMDLPGHGRSGGAPLESIEAVAAWVFDVLDAAGVERSALVGHSMGSLVVLEAAATRPERIHRLALLGTASPMTVSKALLNAARDNEPRAMAMINAWSHSPRGLMGGTGAPGSWIFAANARLMSRAAPGVLFTDLSACNAYRCATASAAAVRCPALVIAAEHDQMTPARAARPLVEALGDVCLVELPETGHNMTAEQPGMVLEHLRSFLSTAMA